MTSVLRSMNATAPQLFSHLGNDGEAFWSPVPPNGACEGTPPPIYYEPMCVEEPSPEPDLRMAKLASRAERLVRNLSFSGEPLRMPLRWSWKHLVSPCASSSWPS